MRRNEGRRHREAAEVFVQLLSDLQGLELSLHQRGLLLAGLAARLEAVHCRLQAVDRHTKVLNSATAGAYST